MDDLSGAFDINPIHVVSASALDPETVSEAEVLQSPHAPRPIRLPHPHGNGIHRARFGRSALSRAHARRCRKPRMTIT